MSLCVKHSQTPASQAVLHCETEQAAESAESQDVSLVASQIHHNIRGARIRCLAQQAHDEHCNALTSARSLPANQVDPIGHQPRVTTRY
jgi:hypothetical protein